MSAHQFQIARGVPSPRLSIGRPASPSSPGRAATPIINDQMAVRSRGWGVPRQRCVLPFDRIFVGIGERSTALHAINQYAADHSGNDAVEPLKSHFINSAVYAPNLDRGGHDEIHEHSTSGAANDC